MDFTRWSDLTEEEKYKEYTRVVDTYKYKNTCYNCRGSAIWGNDFDFEEYGIDGEGIVSVHSCNSCNTIIELYTRFDEEELCVK